VLYHSATSHSVAKYQSVRVLARERKKLFEWHSYDKHLSVVIIIGNRYGMKSGWKQVVKLGVQASSE